MGDSSSFTPGYLRLLERGTLEAVVDTLTARLSHCNVCPWNCGVDRLRSEVGFCRTGSMPRVSSYGPHLGEERVLSGSAGSGTIFFSRCNMKCQYCQNFDISQTDEGQEVRPEELANIMLELQAQGCHNINFVSPSHVVPQIVASVSSAARAGLHLPLVFNSGGYDSVTTLRSISGVFDIYMPDMKFADAATAQRLCRVPHYPQTNQAAVQEMYRQVGDLVLDDRGLATRGLLVRHLVLPNELAGTPQVVQFLAEHTSIDTYLNLMRQYRPSYRAQEYPEIDRRVTDEEWESAVGAALTAGLRRLDHM